MEKNYQCINVVASGHTAVNMSRHCLLQWINGTLGVKIQKVESLCSGAVYCQFMDILFPGCIPLRKVKFDANVINEYWSNFKQLQMAFRAVGCEKDVPIDRLIEGRFQENFEFLQWFKKFYDANIEQPPTSAKSKQTQKASQLSTSRTSAQQSTSRTSARPVAIVNPVWKSGHGKELKSQILEYQERARKAGEEKDLFFCKLRKIELLCTADEASSTKKKDFVEKILAELYSEEVDYGILE